MSAALVFIALLTALIATVWFYVKNAFSFWERRGVPFLKPTFPFGNFGAAFTQKLAFAELLKEVYDNTDEPVLGAYSLISPTLIVCSPEIVQDVYIKEFSSFSHKGMYACEELDPMANNLLLQKDEKWKRNRSKLTPAFSSLKLKLMFDTIVECGAPLEQHIEQYAKSGETFEIREVFARFTTNVIASVAFGIEVDCIANPDSEFRRYGKKFFEPTAKNMFRFNLAVLYPKIAEFFRFRFTDADVGEFMIETVRQNLEYREKNNIERKDFFQLLMQLRNTGNVKDDDDWSAKPTSSEKSMSLEEMAAQAFLFFVGGFETTSTTMAFCMYELARNPEAQSKAYAEINEVLRRHDGKLTYESINEMKYMENCIDETLRMHAPFQTIPRECTKDYKLPDSDAVIQTGIKILIPVYALHHDPKYYEQPFKFMPERFSEEATRNKTFVSMPYMPFGQGPRICLGLRLGKLKTKIAVVLLLQKFQFELGAQHLNKKLKLDARSVVTTSVDGINVTAKLR